MKTTINHHSAGNYKNDETNIVTPQTPSESKGVTRIPNRNANNISARGTTYIAGSGKAAEEQNTQIPSQPLLKIGETVFNSYVIKQQITKGVGAEAQIYLAETSGTKFIVKAYTYEKEFNERVYDTLKRLNNRNIARLYQYGYHNSKLPVEVVEYFDGGSLEGRRFSLDELRRTVGQINEGLKALHERLIYINDLKPNNIVVSHGRVAIVDFSLCTIESPHSNANNGKEFGQGCGTYTMRNLVGTPGYSCPEYYLSGISSRAGDYYSLGVTMFELFFGYPPFRNIATLGDWINILINRVNIFPSNTPTELEIIRHLITYDPHNRCSTYNDIKRFANGETLTFASSNSQPIKASFFYTINNEVATDRQSLRNLLVKHWDKGGLDRFLHNDIYNSFVSAQGGNQDIAAICKKISDSYANRRREEGELAYLEFLYRLYPEDKRFVWRGMVFNNTEAISNFILSLLRNGNDNEPTTLISLGALSVYYSAIGMPEQARTFMALESAYKKAASSKTANPYATTRTDVINTNSLKYAYGFVLSQNKMLMIRDKLYSERDIAANIGSFVNDLTDSEGFPTPEYAGFLIAEGRINLN